MIGGEILSIAKFYSIRNVIIYFTVTVFIMSVVLSSFPKGSAANDTLDEQDIVNEAPYEIIEFIKDTEEEIIYKTLEDGKIYLYEEQIVGDVITTKKSLVANGTSTLTEKFSTTSILNGDMISVIQKDLLTNMVINDAKISISEPLPSYDDSDVVPPKYASSIGVNNEYTTMATGTWVNSRTAGQKYAYYKYSNGGGLARQGSRQKAIGSYTTKFDNYTRLVDSARSYELGALYNFTILGVLDKGLTVMKNPTYANVKTFLKQYFKSVPVVGTVYLVMKYFSICNKTMAAYKAIPGTDYYWRS